MSAPRLNTVAFRNLEAGLGGPNSAMAPVIPNVGANIERGIANAQARMNLLQNIERGRNLRPLGPSAPPMNNIALAPYLSTLRMIRNQIRNAGPNANRNNLTLRARNTIQQIRAKIPNTPLDGTFTESDKDMLRKIKPSVRFRNEGAMGGKSRRRRSSHGRTRKGRSRSHKTTLKRRG